MKLSLRLGLAYGFLFAAFLTVTGITLLVTVRRTVSHTIVEGLIDVATIAAHHVNRSTWSRWELLERNRRIVEQWVANAGPDYGTAYTLGVHSDYSEQPREVVMPALLSLEPDTPLEVTVDRLSRATEGEVALVQATPFGLVIVESTGGEESERGRGYLWPSSSALGRLIDAHDEWIGREYVDGAWYLCAYLPLPRSVGPKLYVRIAVAQVEMQLLTRDLADIEVGEGGFVYILDTSANVVFDPDPRREGENLSVEPYAREISFGRSGTIAYTTDRHYLAAYQFVASMNWIVVVATTAEGALRDIDTLTRLFAAMFSSAVLLAMGVSLLLGRQISRPITEIARRFQEIADGEGDSVAVDMPPNASREVYALARDFNRFVHRSMELNELERREIALELRQEQMKALQAQINPHFLYNTLETIRFLIEMGDGRAVSTVQTLSDLFRVSLAKGERFTTLADEVRHAALYFEIQRIRYASALRLECSVPDELADSHVLSFFLQPIVENAVVHGIVPTSRPGTVTVSARREEEDLYVEVADDGVGMPSDHLQRLRQGLERREEGREGIGLGNVHERLRLSFGPRYGLSIEARPSEGTTVRLVMPADPHRRSFF